MSVLSNRLSLNLAELECVSLHLVELACHRLCFEVGIRMRSLEIRFGEVSINNGCPWLHNNTHPFFKIINNNYLYNKKRRNMGNDGGSIAKRSEMVKMQKKKLQRMKEGQKA